MNRKKKQILFLVCLILIILAILVVAITMDNGSSHSTDYHESEREDVVVYGGKEYQYDEHLSNYLIMGIDTREIPEGYESREDIGRADAIYLLSYNRVDKTVKCIAIPRDTMTNIHTYSTDGSDLGLTEDHITMQYLYGDGKDESCRLMIEAVSNLLYGIPIQGYCSLNMDGIPVAVGALGSVEVIVPNDSLEPVDPKYKEGAEVTITEENAERFVRYRNTNIAHSAIARMERQKAFMEAFAESAKNKVAQDSGFVVRVYESLKPYMVTNMGNDVFAKLLDAKFDSEDKIQDIPGEKVDGNEFDEYHINEEHLYEMVLEMFYKDVQGD